MAETLVTATEQVETVLPEAAGVSEVVADKGYHSNETMVDPAAGFGAILRSRTGAGGAGRTRRRLGTRCMGNRRRVRGKRGRRLLRRRGELVERPFAHLFETGGMRRVHLRGHSNILKRLLVHVAGLNLGLLLRQAIGAGTPRGLRAGWHPPSAG